MGSRFDRDAVRPAVQAARGPLHHAVGQRFAQPVQFFAVHRVFQSRQRRLRSQVRPLDGIAPQPQFVNRVFRQPIRVLRIRIAAGNAIHALLQQFSELVIHLAGRPLIGQAGGHAFRQPLAPVRRFQQKGASVGTAVPLIKLDHDWLGKNIGKQQTLCCGMFSQAKASVVASNPVFKHVCSTGGFSCLPKKFENVNYPGRPFLRLLYNIKRCCHSEPFAVILRSAATKDLHFSLRAGSAKGLPCCFVNWRSRNA